MLVFLQAPKTDTRMVEHLGPIQILIKCLNVPYCCCPRWNAFESCSPFVLSFFSCEVAVGVGGSDEIDQSAPTQTAPQQVGFRSGRDRGVDKVSRGPHDDGLGRSHKPGT